jgi:hypothetical protein
VGTTRGGLVAEELFGLEGGWGRVTDDRDVREGVGTKGGGLVVSALEDTEGG